MSSTRSVRGGTWRRRRRTPRARHARWARSGRRSPGSRSRAAGRLSRDAAPPLVILPSIIMFGLASTRDTTWDILPNESLCRTTNRRVSPRVHARRRRTAEFHPQGLHPTTTRARYCSRLPAPVAMTPLRWMRLGPAPRHPAPTARGPSPCRRRRSGDGARRACRCRA